ncbi:MAG TPA: phenylalanine--tRNA ligase subunit beta [Myxococcales bacterium]|nr:phenylalanine--tRNA ligase subunit beta [Myxococcales bacterium]
MRFVSDWVAEWLEGKMPQADVVAADLTDLGVEVEGVLPDADVADQVVIGRVLVKDQHPNADRLSLCQVDIGAEAPSQIVCGAPNHRQGDLVAVAVPGAVLPGGFEIKQAKIRGEASSGMMCSMKELGLGEDHEGIMILAPDAVVGQPLSDYLRNGGRFVLELGVTPNRGDALSMIGLARELSLRHDSLVPKPLSASVTEAGPHYTLDLDVQDSACSYYGTRLVRGITIGSSPDWLQGRLHAAGVRPINNVVDVTNYILMSHGQPLHAFDAARLRPNEEGELSIRVRKASQGESITTLDGQDRSLVSDDLLICDGKGPVALAGVMGGADSEVHSGTQEVLIEAALFDPATVRRTARRLALHSESSHRFERGTDPQRVEIALDEAARMMADIAGGVVAEGRVRSAAPPSGRQEIEFDLADAEQLIGLKLGTARAAEILNALGCEVNDQRVITPSWRPDLSRPADLAEELLRVVGMAEVPEALPPQAPPTDTLTNVDPREALGRALRNGLRGQGFHETVSLAFASPRWIELSERQGLAISNPLGEETRFLRNDLRPQLVEAAARNIRHGLRGLRFCEQGSVFHPEQESKRFALLIETESGASGLACVRGLLEGLLVGQGLGVIKLHRVEDPFLHPRSSAQLMAGDVPLGSMGEVHPKLRADYDLPEGLWLVDLDLAALLASAQTLTAFVALPRFPAVHRDLAMVVPETQPAGALAELAGAVDPRLMVKARVFDVYRGAGIETHEKSVAVRFSLQSGEGTLKEKEITEWLEKYQSLAEERIGARLRR